MHTERVNEARSHQLPIQPIQLVEIAPIAAEDVKSTYDFEETKCSLHEEEEPNYDR